MGRAKEQLTRRIQALLDFQGAVAALIAMSSFNPASWGGQPAIAPKPGQESDWHKAKASVDRIAPSAARSFQAAGVFVEWKPPGTWNTHPINPAIQWGTILGPDPRFTIDVLDACINQAIGSLEDQLRDPPPRRSPALPRVPDSLVPAVFKWIAGIAAAVLAGGIIYWLGWGQ